MKFKAILLLLLLIGTNPIFLSYSSHGKDDSVYPSILRLEDGWEYVWIDTFENDIRIPKTGWKKTENVKELEQPRNNSDILYLRNTLPELSWNDPALFISFMYGTFEVYQGDQLLYQYGEIPETDIVTYKGYNRRHFIELDREAPYNEIIIRSYSNGNLIGVAGAVSIGSYSTYLQNMVQDDFDKILLGAIQLFIALVAFIFFFIKKFDMLYLAFAIASFCSALYSFSITGTKQLIIDYPYVWIYVFQLAVFFRSAFDLMIIDKLFGPGYKKLVRRLWQIHLTLASIAFTLSIINPDYFTFTKGIFEKLSAFEVLFILVIITRLLLKNMEAKIFTIGYIAMAGFMIRDLLVFTGVIYLEKFYLLGHIGQFALIIAVGIILMKRHQEVRKK